jgi:hypothetical protein
MISYSIDASVYAYPFQQPPSDSNELWNYCKTINDLYDLVYKIQPRNKKIYLFLKDIKFVIKQKDLNFIVQDISSLEQTFKENGRNKTTVQFAQRAQNNLNKLFKRLLEKPKEDKPPEEDNQQKKDKLPEKIIFENWFHIENVIFKENKSFTLPDDIDKVISNKDLKENTKKNMAKIAFLNKYVYNNDNIHNIILGRNISAQSILINDTDFSITMNGGASELNGRPYNYVIKDGNHQDIHIVKQNINISTLDTFVIRDWENVLNNAEEDFKHLKFGLEVRSGLKQYIKKIESYKPSDIKTQKEYIKWIQMGPNSLYENLKALNSFVSTAELNPAPINSDIQRYHCCKEMCEKKECFESKSGGKSCNGKCEFLEKCGSNIRFFGVDCADERWASKNNFDKNDPDNFFEKDRKKKNSMGIENIYWTHLRPITFECDDPLWFLTLRIHFRILEPLTARKIEIGWIGRHLYHCPKEKNISNCKRQECPLNRESHLHDPNADKLTNYLKQWPKQEPASPLIEREKSSEKAPENH